MREIPAARSIGARCAVLAPDEPLAGTAPVTTRWACLENRGRWPSDIAAHPDHAVAGFIARATAAGMRLLLIRRPGRRQSDEPVSIFLADTTPGRTTVTTQTVEGPTELADVALPAPGEELPGRPVPDPLLLVCTHGRRDRCCALDGRALAVGLAEAGERHVWECSHLGGHRFAPTALVLPTGYLYGRLDVASAIAARKAADVGEVETALCRGRSTWSPAGQVAELAVRHATALRDADVLTVEPGPATGPMLVTARSGGRWAVDVVRSRPGAARPVSCGVDPTPVAGLEAAAVRRLP